MQFQLVKGSFIKQDALHIITRMIDVKIKFQEDKIKHTDNEEDIKMRESRIKQLQKDLYEARNYIEHQKGLVSIHSDISL